MRQVYRITSDGFFVEDVLLPSNASVPPDCVRQQAPQGFNWPKWNGTRGENAQGAWVGGGGIYHRQPDGKLDPSKRHAEVAVGDGEKIQRGADGKLKRNGVVVPENR